MRSTEDLNFSCEKFPFWSKVSLVSSRYGDSVVLHFLVSIFYKRNIFELEKLFEFSLVYILQTQLWQLRNKLLASKQSLEGDKFLYVHDISDNAICKVQNSTL